MRNLLYKFRNFFSVVNKKKFIVFLITFLLIVCTLLLIEHKYWVSANGYKISFANKHDVANTTYEQLVEDNVISLRSNDVIEQKIIIYENSPEYMYLFTNNSEIDSEAYYKVQILTLDNEILLEQYLKMGYLVYNRGREKFKINVSDLTKGEYILRIEQIGDLIKNELTYNTANEGTYLINDEVYEGTINFAILYKNNEKYLMLYVFLFLITIVYLTILFLNFKFRKVELHKKFLFTSIVIYLMYLIIIPPLTGHDELRHWVRIFEITEGSLVPEMYENDAGSMLPGEIVLNIPWVNEFRYDDLFEKRDFELDYTNRVFISDGTMAVYSPIQYFPQVIGVAIAKLFSNNVLFIFYVGRLFNMVACIYFLYLAIKLIPCFKKLIYLLAFIPISIEGFTILSGDGILIAISFFVLAYVLNLIDRSEKLTKKDYIILVLVGIFLAFSKIVYVALIGILLLIPSKCFKNKKDKAGKMVIIFLVVILANLFWLKIANPYLQLYTYGKSDAQIAFILANPLKYLQICLNTIEDYGSQLLLEAYGEKLLWFDMVECNTLIPISFIITSLVIIFNENYKKINNLFSNIVMIGIFGIITLLIFTSLFVQWTGYGADFIDGLQGRYFICILPIALILISNFVKYKSNLSAKLVEDIVISICLFVSYSSILEIFIMFF